MSPFTKCQQKIRFDTKQDAAAYLAKVKRFSGHREGHTQVYRCDCCAGYHFGSRRKG